MSAVAESKTVTLGEIREFELSGGSAKATSHAVMFDGNEIGTITKFNGFWNASIYGSLYCSASANAETPAEAMAAALTSGISKMADALSNVRAMAVEQGDELLSLAGDLA